MLKCGYQCATHLVEAWRRVVPGKEHNLPLCLPSYYEECLHVQGCVTNVRNHGTESLLSICFCTSRPGVQQINSQVLSLKIFWGKISFFEVRLQQSMNWELPHVQAAFREGREARDQIANICWIREKAREFQKNIYFCFIDCAKAFDCPNHNKLWKILKEMWILDHLTCLLRNLYAGQEATVRTRHGTKDWFKIGKGSIQKGCILSPCLFNLCRVHHMKFRTGWIRSWNQDCQGKYQQPQICRWCHSNGRKWEGSKKPLDEGERRKWKSWLKTQHSKN